MNYQYPVDPEPSNNPDAVTMCKNSKCSAIVPPSKKGGKPRKFCSARCNHNFHALAWANRNSVAGITLAPIVTTVLGPQFRRTKCRKFEDADRRLKEHHRECILNGGSYCLATSDTYGQDRICLIKSVLYEDRIELYRIKYGHEYRDRVVTTEQGRWNPDFEPPPRIVVSKLPRIPVID